MYRPLLSLFLIGSLLGGCNGNDDAGEPPVYNFESTDSWIESFVQEEAAFDGASIIIVDKDFGVIHTASFGDHSTDDIFMLASVSKVPSVSLLMALADDPNIDFDIDTPIENYLPWVGVYPGITTAHLVSNTSGIPGLFGAFDGTYLPAGHLCQYVIADDLQTCAQTIYQNLLAGTVAPGTQFDYGGSQWHLSGAVAENVGGDSWPNLFDRYIAQPCDLEVFEYGNMLGNTGAWTGSPDSLVGQNNANPEGGAISNLTDMAKLLRMQLNNGLCGDNRVISEQQAQRMRVDIGTAVGSREWLDNGRGYGLGWWVPPQDEQPEPTHFNDPGAFGSVSWIDTERGYGVFVALTQYDDLTTARQGPARILPELVPIVDQAIDNSIE